MVKKSAVKKESSKKTQAKESTKKDAAKKKSTKKQVAKKRADQSKSTSKNTAKANKTLLTRGKRQGYLTYDEINELVPEDMLLSEQIDETLMLFYANNIEIIEAKHQKKT